MRHRKTPDKGDRIQERRQKDEIRRGRVGEVEQSFQHVRAPLALCVQDARASAARAMGALSRLGYNRRAWAETNVPMTTKPDSKILRQQIRYVKATDGTQLAWAQSGQGPMLVKAANWLTHLEYETRSPVWKHWLEFFSA